MNNLNPTPSKTNGTRTLISMFRFVSFLVALAVLALVVIYPRIIATDIKSVQHGWLVLTMFGMSLLFVYGIGFTPNNKYLRFIINPIVGWLAIAIGSWRIFL